MAFKTLWVAASLVAGTLSISGTASAGPDEYIGEIILVGYNFCPRGTMEADGQLLAISENTALFSLYGTYYGGDGRTTFALPDLRGRTIVGQGNGPGLTNRKMGQSGGAETTRIMSGGVASEGDKVAVPSQSPVNNMQPFTTLRYCIVTEGVYPSRR